MRYDMAEVVIERPRARSGNRFHSVRVRYKGMDLNTLDDLPKNQGYRRPFIEGHGDCKEFSDLLGPLHRFLISKVGQKWNDVYSEVRERLNPDSTVQIHIIGHLFQFIETETYIGDDGEVCYNNPYGSANHIGAGELYVHPETGIICRTAQVSRKRDPAYHVAEKHLRDIFGKDWYEVCKKKYDAFNKINPRRAYYSHSNDIIGEANNHVRVGHERELHKMNGVWYWAIFADVPPPFTLAWFDSASGTKKTRTVNRGACDYWTGVALTEGRYRNGRRQASRRDLRRHGLNND